jgi:hypothetical protein
VTEQSMFTLPEMAPDPESAAGSDAGSGCREPGSQRFSEPAGTGSGVTAEPEAAVLEPPPCSGSDGSGTGSELVPALAVPARRTGFAESLLLLLRQRVTLIADYQRRHRTFWHAVTVFITRPPETWAETEEHLRSRKWLQEWMTGKFRVFCEWENIAWGHLVSMPAKAVLQNIEKVFFERQLGFWLGLVSIGLGVLIWLVTS